MVAGQDYAAADALGSAKAVRDAMVALMKPTS